MYTAQYFLISSVLLSVAFIRSNTRSKYDIHRKIRKHDR